MTAGRAADDATTCRLEIARGEAYFHAGAVGLLDANEQHAMEELAALSGDVDALIAVKLHSLSNPHAFLQLAEIRKQHRRHDEALALAEKGMAAFRNELAEVRTTWKVKRNFMKLLATLG